MRSQEEIAWSGQQEVHLGPADPTIPTFAATGQGAELSLPSGLTGDSW